VGRLGLSEIYAVALLILVGSILAVASYMAYQRYVDAPGPGTLYVNVEPLRLANGSVYMLVTAVYPRPIGDITNVTLNVSGTILNTYSVKILGYSVAGRTLYVEALVLDVMPQGKYLISITATADGAVYTGTGRLILS